MDYALSQNGNQLRMEFTLDEDDNESFKEKFHIGKRTCIFNMPHGWDLTSVHPDLLALTCIAITHPFIGQRVNLPLAISSGFAETYTSITRKEIGPVDESIKRREPSGNPRPGLAYSGGLDSTVAIALMPADTVSIFLDRIVDRNRPTLYDKDAAHWACESLQKRGYHVLMVGTDLEYVRDPIGFPVDIANATPALLLSDMLSLDSIGFGTIMESAYGIGHELFRDYPNGHHYLMWGRLFSAAGLPFFQAVAGISEVGTTIISMNSPLGEYAQSCMRGQRQNPCHNCWKCFRKLLLEAVLNGHELDNHWLDSLFKIKEAKHFLRSFPIKHENVLTFATSLYNGNHETLNLLKRRVRGDILPVEWMQRWYPPSLDVIPEQYKANLVINIRRFLEPMTEEMQNFTEAWDMTSMLKDSHYVGLHEQLLKFL